LQEERRLFYVASTRAKKHLFLTAGEDYGGKRAKKLSQFVLELLNEVNFEKVKHKLEPIEKIERFKKLQMQLPKLQSINTDEILKLSRQKIDDYSTCPKKYYLAHVIKIPLLENHQLMYGTAIHSALDHYFNRKTKGENPDLQSLIDDFKQSFYSVGFITREHEDQRYKKGIETLTQFYNIDQVENTIPSDIEMPFEFFEENVKINGRYDLIYNSKNDPIICDFKTSDVREQKEADRRIKQSTQMMMYALSWFEKYNVIPKTVLYFIESNLKGEITFTKKQLDETKEMIFEVASGIRNQDYTAKPDKFNCNYCPYKEICPESRNK